MLFALDENGQRVNIKDSKKGNKYVCACCLSEVVQKKGNVKAWHYSHKSRKNCDDWYEMTEWHKDWQNNFKEEHQEVVVKNELGKHRADVKIGNLVIEFQHSNMTGKEFQKRSDFYSKDNTLYWVFDVRDKDIVFRNSEGKATQHFLWTHAYKFNNIDIYKCKFKLFLQIREDVIVHATWNKQGFKYFGGFVYTKQTFIERLQGYERRYLMKNTQ